MDMLGGSPQSDCYLTQGVYTVLPHFRSGFRLCGAAIADLRDVSISRLEGRRAKRDTFLQGFGVARFRGADLGLARGQLCIIACRRWRSGMGVHRPKDPKTAIADLGGGQHPQSALLESQGAFGRKACAARAL